MAGTAPARIRGEPYLPLANPTFANPPWEDAPLRALVVRLSPFSVAERSSTHLLLAAELRRAVPRAYVDMLFVPPAGSRASPWTLESVYGLRSPPQFDLLLLSNSYMLELLNVPPFLEGSGIPLEAGGRGDSDPLVILGGANAMAAHPLVEPLAEPSGGAEPGWAGYVDAIFFGEGEGEVGRMASCLAEHRGEGRRRVLEALSRSTPALWVPLLAKPERVVRKAVLREVRASDIPTEYPLLDGEEAGTARLQITWGCPALCSFCFESYDRRPYREAPLPLLLEAARLLKQKTGAGRLELFSFNFSYYRDFPVLLRELSRLFGAVSFMSQRIDVLARNPRLLPLEIAAGKRSYTLGIEGVSSRLRAFLQKGIAAEDLHGVLEALIRSRVREIKLFYIITGYEEDRDLAELDGFLGHFASKHRFPGMPRLVLSFTYLLRMPFTPLRHDPPLLERDRAERIERSLRRVAAARGLEMRLAGEWEEHVTCQLLASAGYRGRGLLRALAGAGVSYDGGLPARAWSVVERWMAENTSIVASLGEAATDHAAEPPFAFVEGGAESAQLRARYREAVEALAGDSPERPFRFSPVHAAIDVEGMEELSRKRQLLEHSAVHALADLPRETAGSGREWRNAWLMREVFRAAPELVQELLRVEEVSPGWEAGVGWYGRCVARLVSWEPAALSSRLGVGIGPLLHLAPRAEPGEFRELEARILLEAAQLGRVREAMAEFLRAIHCATVTSREGGSYVSAVTAQVRKRRSLYAARVGARGSGVEVLLRCGPRLPMAELVDCLAQAAGGGRPAVEVLAIELDGTAAP